MYALINSVRSNLDKELLDEVSNPEYVKKKTII